ncbi:uncharacterized protein AMSG_12401 [Thecamonas trahens ATCC 50062]|uniref:DUF7630 domain-containing protein n=1 Tax=Thecamonas trahens ATCC 50062 TaxID=461836 RepID=A0A0L0DUX0_THETB|nr:hypothetical protein AMSG_12401 [Thecamonas trahens ATCC 50062]KNC55313.1 hypothetical protein AMSG_12401 [Thecamonas trahens ATCC 50062]|eukprot:XP_013753076.1 hypothetical protein AMSG_12401 [Thecamonas trahens ATCC 50062]
MEFCPHDNELSSHHFTKPIDINSATLYTSRITRLDQFDIDGDAVPDYFLSSFSGVSFLPSTLLNSSYAPARNPSHSAASMGPAACMADVYSVSLAHYDCEFDRAMVADFNADNVLDIFVDACDGNPIAVLPGSLTRLWPRHVATIPVTAPAYGSQQRFYIADIDADGDNDVVWFSTSDSTDFSLDLVWIENTGAGALALTRNVIEPYHSNNGRFQSVDVADVNADGFPDIVWQTSSGDTFLRHATAPGVFGPRISLLPKTSDSYFLQFFDYDADGRLDVVQEDPKDNNIIVYVNGATSPTDDFVVAERVEMVSGSDVTCLEVADFDKDGDHDLVYGSFSEDKLRYAHHTSGSSFTYSDIFSLNNPSRIALGDINGDTYLDVCSYGAHDLKCAVYESSVSAFGVTVWTTPAPDASDIVLADMNADGLADLLVLPSTTAGSFRAGATLYYYRNSGLLTTPFSTSARVGVIADTLAGVAVLIDVDSDGDTDVTMVYFNGKSITLTLLANTHVESGAAPGDTPAFVLYSIPVTPPPGNSWPNEVVALDDGRFLILFSSNYDDVYLITNVSWFEANTTASLTLVASGTFWNGFHITDINNDGFLDFVYENLLANDAILAILDIRGVGLENLYADGGERIVVADGVPLLYRSSFIHLNPSEDDYIDYIEARYVVQLSMGLPRPPNSVVLVDATGDGFVDILAPSSFEGIRVFPYLAAGAVKDTIVTAVDSTAGITASTVADLNGDGWPELIAFDPSGTFTIADNAPRFDNVISQSASMYAGDIIWLEAADIDRDARPDLVALVDDDRLVWYRNTGAEPYFVSSAPFGYNRYVVIDSGTIRNAKDFVIVNLNNDAWLDIVISSVNNNAIYVLMGHDIAQDVKAFYPPHLSVDLGSPCSSERFVRAVDVTADGLLDLFVVCSAADHIIYAPSLGAAADANGTLTWETAAPITIMLSSSDNVAGFQLGDINNDGLVDIVLSFSSLSSPYRYLINIGSSAAPAFSSLHDIPMEVDWDNIVPGPSNPNPLGTGDVFALVDLDWDGYLDVVGSSSSAYAIILLNAGSGPSPAAFDDANPGLGIPRLASAIKWYQKGKTFTRARFETIDVLDADGDGYPDWFSSSSHTDVERAVVSGINSNWRLPRGPRNFTVPIDRCGYTLACIASVISTQIARCGDSVVLPPGTYTGCWSSRRFVVGKSVRIVGGGASRDDVIIDCSSVAATPFEDGSILFAVEEERVELVLDSLTIIGGTSPETSFGGGLLTVSHGSLVLSSVVIRNATSVTADQLSVIDSLLDANTAQHSGGAIAAVGNSMSITLERSVCSRNIAEVSGGCIFLESASGFSYLTIIDSHLSENTAVGTSPAIAASRRGGAVAVIALADIVAVNLLGSACSLADNIARENAGALFLRTSTLASAKLTLNSCSLTNNIAQGGDGGGVHALALDASELNIYIGAGTLFSGNSAVGSGGALALESDSAAANAAINTTAPGAAFRSNVADLHGGALVASGKAVSTYLVDVLFERNLGRRIGGAIMAVGHATVRLVGGTLSRNSAAFGGAFGITSAPDYLRASLTRNGFPVEASSASLEPLLADSDDTAPCAARGALLTDSVHLDSNIAVYGSIGFACGARLATLGDGAFAWDSSARVGGIAPSSGLFFACMPQPGFCSRVGDPCCLADSRTEFLRGPWMAASDAMVAAYNASFSDIAASVGYGPVMAMPLVELEWTAALPTESSGRDGLGQTIVDPQLAISLAFADDATDANFAFVGAGRLQLMSEPAGVSFAGVGIAARAGVDVGVDINLVASVAQSAVDVSVAPSAVITARVRVQACLPGSGALVRDGSSVLECALCDEGLFSDTTSLDPCAACPPSSVLAGRGAIDCYTCPVNAQLVPGFVPVPGRGLNCTCIPGTWTDSGGARCAGGIALPVAIPGYFPTADPGIFLECPNPTACSGGYPFVCAQGYTGRLCGACARGYYALSGACYKCDDRTIPLLIAAFVAAVALVAFLVWLNSREELTYRFAAIMIGFNSLQISAMYGQIDLEWPPFAASFFNVVSLVNLNFDLSSPECATVTDHVWLLKWWLTVWRAIAHRSALRPPALTLTALLDASRRAYLQLMVLLYLPLAAKAMSYFQCRRDRDGRWVLEAAPAKSCYGTWYWNYFAFALIFAGAYAGGIPALVYWLLTRVRAKSDSILFSLRYAFLVGRFLPRAYRYEVWIMARKASVVLAMTVFRSPRVKANVALFALMSWFCHLLDRKPYASPFHNILALFCLATCAAILWSITFDAGASRTLVAITAIVINVVAIVAGVVVDAILIYRRHAAADKDLADGEDATYADFGYAADGAILSAVPDAVVNANDSNHQVASVTNPVFTNGDRIHVASSWTDVDDTTDALALHSLQSVDSMASLPAVAIPAPPMPSSPVASLTPAAASARTCSSSSSSSSPS